MKLRFSILLSLSIQSILLGQSLITYKENKGQWPSSALFMSESYGGKSFLEKDGFVFDILNEEQLISTIYSSRSTENNRNSSDPIQGHVYKEVFVGSDPKSITGEEVQAEHYNYYLGKDPNNWYTRIKAFKKIKYNNLYSGIDMNVYSEGMNMKYDLLVSPKVDPSVICIKIEYANEINLKKGEIHIKTNAGTIIEKAPLVYQIIHNKKKFVSCEYKLNGNEVRFHFPEGYDKCYELVIDPVIITCTFTGSTNYCNGQGSASDEKGDAYLVGSCMNQGFPATFGAYQTTHNAMYDMTFHKFNSDGSQLLYATYIGGIYTEESCSVYINKNEVCIMGYSNSPDFPVTANAFDTSANGQSDIVVLKFDTSGNNLIASTYVGGLENDGNPGAWLPNQQRNFELIMDTTGNSYIVNASASPDFPVTANSFDNTFNGAYDAIACKMSKGLDTIFWSTYIGGSDNDCGSSLRPDGQGGIYFTGSTVSNDFPTTAGTASTIYNGLTDAFVVHLDKDGQTIISSTYVGTNGKDLGYLLTLDEQNNVYVYSLMMTGGSLTTTINAYNVPAGRNVIYRLRPDLSQYTLKARFGTSTFNGPSSWVAAAAFEVDSCGNIYIAGDAGPNQPTTPDALKPTTNNFDLYYCVFSKDASALKYGSYFGGPQSEWATYGICRMTKTGMMYYSFNGNYGTPITSNAYAPSIMNTGSLNTYFDHGFLKIDLQTFLTATSYSSQQPTGCEPYQLNLTNQSPTNEVEWNFGDGTTSIYNQNSVTHTYDSIGNFDLMMIVTDTSTCNNVDTLITQIQVYSAPQKNLQDSVELCLEKTVELNAGNSGASYLWSTGETIQTINVAEVNWYIVSISNPGCTVNDSSFVFLSNKNYESTFPNIITPNGDGVNDELLLNKLGVEEIEITIMNRWGEPVFKSNNTNDKWNGTVNGKVVDGTYFYVIKYTSGCGFGPWEAKGYITVIK